MAIKEPRKFVTTDQGHADVLNVPITTLYENDQALAAQVDSIKNDPAASGVASKKALDDHAADTNLHVTAAKQAAWNAAEANAKQYVQNYAAPKVHTHTASDLPSASTQARGPVQLNTSVSSAATDQAATPSAVKAANDRANEAYNRADQAFTQASDLKSKVANAITGKGGSANSGMNGDQLAASINGLAVRKKASGNLNSNLTLKPQTSSSPATTTYTIDLPTDFSPSAIMLNMGLSVVATTGNYGQGNHGVFFSKDVADPSNNNGTLYAKEGSVTMTLTDKTLNFVCNSNINNVTSYTLTLERWCAYE
jgi:phage-related tail fiber protein